jgi:hypothetical protein
MTPNIMTLNVILFKCHYALILSTVRPSVILESAVILVAIVLSVAVSSQQKPPISYPGLDHKI